MSIRPLFFFIATTATAPAFCQFNLGSAPPLFDSAVSTPAIAPLPRLRLSIGAPGQAMLAASKQTCYAIRSYEFSQPGSSSEAPKITGTTTCQPSSTSHLKATVLFPSVTPRK